MLHIALVSRTTDEQQQLLRDQYDCELHDFSNDRDGLAKHGDIIEIVLGNVRPFELPQMKKLKWIQATWAGIDNLIYPEMKQAGVIITNVRGQCATSMAEHAIAGLFYFAREFHRHVEGCRKKKRTRTESQFHIAGSTVCVLGMGGVGEMIAAKLAALGANVIGVNTSGTSTENCADMCTLETIGDRLGEIDHVVCTLPATSHTDQFINKAFLTGLKKGACICNVSRGSVVNEDDLIECIDSGQICGAMLDVSSPEPPEPHSLLWNNPKVLFTSHTSYGPAGEPGKGGFDVFCRNLPHYINGDYDKMINVVDFELEY